jgi:hypothetical protein
MDNNDKIILVSLQRSGSTKLSVILNHTLMTKYPFYFNNSFLKPFYGGADKYGKFELPTLIKVQKGLEWLHPQKMTSRFTYTIKGDLVDVRYGDETNSGLAELPTRCEFLKYFAINNMHQHYKHIVSGFQDKETLSEFKQQGYRLIGTYRQNKWHQFLSYNIAKHSRFIYYKNETLQEVQKQIRLTEDDIVYFKEHLDKYDSIKDILDEEITYEEITTDIDKVSHTLNTDLIEDDDFIASQKINSVSRSNLFANIDEAKELFDWQVKY